MVYSASLGYDPEEWEECPEVEHFLVFSFFTRFFLSAGAIAFAYFFFKLIAENKNKGKKQEDEEPVPVTGEDMLTQVGKQLEQVFHQQQQQERGEYSSPSDVDQLMREADEYLQATPPNRDSSPRPFVEQIQKTAHDVSAGISDVMQKPAQAAHDVYEKIQTSGRQAAQAVREMAEQPIQTTQDAYERAAQAASNLAHDTAQYVGLTSEEQYGSLHRRGQRPQLEKRERVMSGDEQRALREWDEERQRLEEDRLMKLQDREVGGEESELSTSSRAFEQLRPASHISYHSTSPEQPQVQDRMTFGDETPVLEKKLRTEIDQLAGQQQQMNKNRESYRDSELTDYDISDFNVPEHIGLEGSSPAADVHFVPAVAPPAGPGPAPIASRHNTGDSDEYVKVQAEPIYDVPPRSEKAISPEEARQLQELCQEYDFGADLTTSPPRTPESLQAHQQFGVAPVPPPRTHAPSQIRTGYAPLHSADQSPAFGVIGDRPSTSTSTGTASALIRQTTQEDQMAPTYHIQLKGGANEDTKNLVDAEMYVQDALEYLGNQGTGPSPGGFVMEEDMLSSHANSHKKQTITPQTKQQSGDATSQMVKTMDVFDRVEHDEHDVDRVEHDEHDVDRVEHDEHDVDRVEHDEHDDMTYAPEIQSVEIPPDQMSENSDNLQEYFDRVAAEGGQLPALAKPSEPAARNVPIQITQQAPVIHSASGHRAASSTSLASGRSGRSLSGISSDGYPRLRKQSSLLSVLGVTSMQEMLLTINSLDDLSDAMRKAGLESTNMIFGIDYTASNKYQGEDSFGGRSLHTIHPNIKNPYQQVITILGRTLAPFASTGRIPVYGFGDAKTGDWSTFPLKQDADCTNLDEVLKVYNEVTPSVDLSGPTNFAPLIYQAMEICQKANDYHILVVIADGQVTNERATRRAIVQACQYPLSIIVVGVGDGPWDMMKVFDESLPKRAWDNFHFVQFHDIMKKTVGLEEGDVKLAVQSLLEIPDQYRCICELGLLRNRPPPMRGSDIRREMGH